MEVTARIRIFALLSAGVILFFGVFNASASQEKGGKVSGHQGTR